MVNDTILITPSGYAKMILHAMKHSTQPLSGLLVGKVVQNDDKHSPPILFISDVIPLTHTQVASLPHPIVEAGVRMVHSQACSEGRSVVGTYFANERFDDTDFGELNRRMAKEVAKICTQQDKTSSSSTSSFRQESGSGSSDNNNNVTKKSSIADSASSSGFHNSDVSSSRHISLLLDNALLCSEEGPVTTLAVPRIFGAVSGAKLAGNGATLKFSTWNRDTGVPDAAQSFDEVKTRVRALVCGKQQPFWDFEDHLENCNARDFYNPWIC